MRAKTIAAFLAATAILGALAVPIGASAAAPDGGSAFKSVAITRSVP